MSDFRPKCLNDKLIINGVSECESCLSMKRELQEMHEELCSARLIIKLLQTEGNIANTIDIAANQGRNHDSRKNNSSEWKLVSTSKAGVNRKTPVQQPQLIPTIINRYKVLDNLHTHSQTHQQHEHANTLPTPIKECDRITNTTSAAQQTKGRYKYNKRASPKKRNRIIIMGNSHARGCAQELRHNLGKGFEVQGNVKPGANLQTIVNVSTEVMRKLTKKDVVVVWGGTRDVARNESEKGLRQICNLAENLKHTNVIVMNVPCRHDLASTSCVNHEVKVYNRKLKKRLKVLANTCVLEVDTDRDLFTRHGLHMNLKGKEHITYKIMETIKVMLNEKKSAPIKLKYKEDLERDNNEAEGENITMETKTGQENSNKDRQSNAETVNKPAGTLSLDTSGNRSSTRQKKAPKSLLNDFLW